ncbi:MAG: glycoside hydrolase family 3 N-terminal domain-containing protein [Pseudomonadota bacterium]
MKTSKASPQIQRSRHLHSSIGVVLASTLATSVSLLSANPLTEKLKDWPSLTSAIKLDPEIEAKVAAKLKTMSLEEKVGQMTQAEIGDISPEQAKKYNVGSVLNGGGSNPGGGMGRPVADWVAAADQFWQASKESTSGIPLIWGSDAVHGHGNIKGAVLFPHNIGLGAARDPALMKRIGQVTALEVARTGLDWTFGPTLAVARDVRWGRAYESYSEDPMIVQAYAGPAVEGLQGMLALDPKANERVIATAKHFLADGGTTYGGVEGNIDRGVTVASELDLINIHARGYFTALQAGAQTVMVSFSEVRDPKATKPIAMHANYHLLTEVLKHKMGFDGFTISDWNAIALVRTSNSAAAKDCSDTDCPEAINAGIDMMMVAGKGKWLDFIKNTVAEVKSGQIKQERIDDAVTRILRVKYRAGMFDKARPAERVKSLPDVGNEAHRALAREAVRKSLVLLKNNDKALPLAPSAKILVVGRAADTMRFQAGGWSINWQGDVGNEQFPGATSLWQAVKAVAPNAKYDANGNSADASIDAAIVVMAEKPYAEWFGDVGKRETLARGKRDDESGDLELLDKLKKKGVKKIITVVYSGRPLYMNKELNRSDAFVAAWLPGSEGGGITDLLFSKDDGSVAHDFSGTLSFAWPNDPCQVRNDSGATTKNLFALGYGQSYAKAANTAKLGETVRSVGCEQVAAPSGPVAKDALAIFNGKASEPWRALVGGPGKWSGDEVKLASGDTTTSTGGELSVTPVDGKTGGQWSALNAVWNNAQGQLYFQSPNGVTKDLTSYQSAEANVVFELKLEARPTDTVETRIDSVYPKIGSLDLAAAFKTIPLNQWVELAIPVACFAGADLDISKVNTPFLINSTGKMRFSIGNVRWEPKAKRAANVKCNGESLEFPG